MPRLSERPRARQPAQLPVGRRVESRGRTPLDARGALFDLRFGEVYAVERDGRVFVGVM